MNRSQREAELIASSAALAHTLTPAPRRRRTDRPRFTYRIDPSIHDALHTIKASYHDAGYQTSIDQIAEDLLAYAVDQWHEQNVEITVSPIEPEARLLTRPEQEK